MAASILEQIESDPGELVALRAAFGEAVDNAARHGNKNDSEKRIDVILRASRETILVRVADEGEGFDHQSFLSLLTDGDEYVRGQAKRPPSRAGGLGIVLMKKTTDALRYLDKGNVVELEKRIVRLRK
jgi:serine/threonine-protein kinase RsbW